MLHYSYIQKFSLIFLNTSCHTPRGTKNLTVPFLKDPHLFSHYGIWPLQRNWWIELDWEWEANLVPRLENSTLCLWNFCKLPNSKHISSFLSDLLPFWSKEETRFVWCDLCPANLCWWFCTILFRCWGTETKCSQIYHGTRMNYPVTQI